MATVSDFLGPPKQLIVSRDVAERARAIFEAARKEGKPVDPSKLPLDRKGRRTFAKLQAKREKKKFKAAKRA